MARPGECPFGACDGSGFIVDEAARTAAPCRCREMLIGRRRTAALSNALPRRYRDVSFESTAVHDLRAKAPTVVRAVERFCRNVDAELDAGRGLWLYGDTGTGKTTLAMLVSKAALEAGRSVAIYPLPKLLNAIRRTYDDGAEMDQVELLERLTAVDLLHLDDVGAETQSAWVLEQLYLIVNARYEEERSIVLTTNLEREALEQQVGARTISRISEMCEPVPLFGGDARREFRAA